MNPYTSLISNRWLPVRAQEVIQRENPAASDQVASSWCPATISEAEATMDTAAQTWRSWAATPLARRLGILSDFLHTVENQTESLAKVITSENGKSLEDARSEIEAALRDARYSLAEAEHKGLRETNNEGSPTSRLLLEPLGVCLLITPWNFPVATVMRKLVQALLYGNTVVLKPSELTPGSCCLLISLLIQCDCPPGVVGLVLGSGATVGPALIGHNALRAISFTGSTRIGQHLSQLTNGRDVRLQLEMGGKNSLVVLADADLEDSVEAALIGGFSCAGQWCTGTGRVIVEQSILEAWVDLFVARAMTFPIGPVITADRLRFARNTLARAQEEGARLRCGGEQLPGGHFLRPAVLDQVHESMEVFREELFVPIMPVIAARSEDDAVRLANLGNYGLSASVFTRDVEKGECLARRIEAGITHVNLHTAYREPSLYTPILVMLR